MRNGYQPERAIQTGIGPVKVKVPKVRSRTGEAVTFHSALVPPYVRKTRSLEAALPWLYLKGISTGEMEDALRCTGWAGGQRPVCQHGQPPETGLGAGIPGLGPDPARCQDLYDHRLYDPVKPQQARQVLRSLIQERAGQ
ncbi:MAG: transposase [Thiothrix sp.]|nr:transposase [Thiothrix sp.]